MSNTNLSEASREGNHPQHEIRIHIDREPYDSPNPTTGHALYALGKIPATHQLYQEVQGDKEDKPVFDDGDEIRLRKDEHFYSAEGRKGYTIIVNARQKEVHHKELTFDEVVVLAFGAVPPGETIIFTVTYRHAAGPKPEGTLVKGETVKIKNGTIFNVTKTNKS